MNLFTVMRDGSPANLPYEELTAEEQTKADNALGKVQAEQTEQETPVNTPSYTGSLTGAQVNTPEVVSSGEMVAPINPDFEKSPIAGNFNGNQRVGAEGEVVAEEVAEEPSLWDHLLAGGNEAMASSFLIEAEKAQDPIDREYYLMKYKEAMDKANKVEQPTWSSPLDTISRGVIPELGRLVTGGQLERGRRFSNLLKGGATFDSLMNDNDLKMRANLNSGIDGATALFDAVTLGTGFGVRKLLGEIAEGATRGGIEAGQQQYLETGEVSMSPEVLRGAGLGAITSGVIGGTPRVVGKVIPDTPEVDTKLASQYLKEEQQVAKVLDELQSKGGVVTPEMVPSLDVGQDVSYLAPVGTKKVSSIARGAVETIPGVDYYRTFSDSSTANKNQKAISNWKTELADEVSIPEGKNAGDVAFKSGDKEVTYAELVDAAKSQIKAGNYTNLEGALKTEVAKVTPEGFSDKLNNLKLADEFSATSRKPATEGIEEANPLAGPVRIGGALMSAGSSLAVGAAGGATQKAQRKALSKRVSKMANMENVDDLISQRSILMEKAQKAKSAVQRNQYLRQAKAITQRIAAREAGQE